MPSKERKRYEREGAEARRRAERRARTQALDLTLRLAELWLRDVLCVAEGAPECVYAVDRLAELDGDAQGRAGALCARPSSSCRTHACAWPERVRGAGAGGAGYRLEALFADAELK